MSMAKHDNYKFQSTPSARRATDLGTGRFLHLRDFNPRPPRGGRLPDSKNHVTAPETISIHALREEGDKSAFDVPAH